VIERSMIFSKDSVLQIGELRSPSAAPTTGLASGADIPLGLPLEEVERRYIDATLQEVGENVAEAAKRLGISRKVLWQRRKRHGLLADSA
jgi:DNA-binding NtrC family response regulator